MIGQLDATTLDGVMRHSYGKLVALLAGYCGDIALAEDGLSEAFASALSAWPRNGCPANPEAWLLTVARRKCIDFVRRNTSQAALEEAIADSGAVEYEDGAIPDRRLALMFCCAHPAIDEGVRAPLILQVILGMKPDKIASAFLMSPASVTKRLVRAKQKIREARIPLAVPGRAELPQRLDFVLQSIYAAFSEGWSDAAGADAAQRELTSEATYLARMTADLLPTEPEVLGLLALMLYAEARRKARQSADGRYVPLERQDVSLWDPAMVQEAEAVLQRAAAFGRVGRFQLEASIQSAHVWRRRTGRSNWVELLQLYDALFAVTESLVVAINRSLVVAEMDGAEAGLDALPDARADARLNSYQPYWAARAELLARLGRRGEADEAYQIAIGLQRDPVVGRFLRERQAALELAGDFE